MNRTLIGISLSLVLLACLTAGLMWYLAVGSNPRGSETITGGEITAPGSVTVSSGIQIEAGSEADAYYLLGFAHGRENAWTLNLLRQTALGRLSEWFGEPLVPLDRLTRHLALSSDAKVATARLEEDDRRILESYAKGVSAAFSRRDVVMNEHLVLFDVDPEPWEAWHSVALERLFAWLSEPPQRPSKGDTAYAALHAFQLADESFRDWIHLHGFEHSSAWATDDSAGTAVEAQFVYGSTSLRLLVPSSLTWPGAIVSGVSLLGTPFFPLSTGVGGTNIVLISSPRVARNRFEAGFPDSLASRYRHERLVLADGSEQLATIPFLEEHLFFSKGSFEGDSTENHFWGSLQWGSGRPASDWPSWRRKTLESAGVDVGQNVGFRLIDGHGLYVGPDGDKKVLGRPVVVESVGSSAIFLAVHPLGSYAGRQFRQLIAAGSTESLSSNVTSLWAEANVHVALGSLRPDSVFSPPVREAIDYLRNWDSRYDLASIGAVIFDAWMGAFTGHRNPFPVLVIPEDSLARVETTARLEISLVETVDSLATVAGSSLARWRLEALRKGERYFPVWSFDPLKATLPTIDSRRYAPLSINQPGHPTTVAWESGLFDYPRNSPAHVVAQTRTAGSPRFAFRPDYDMGSGIIARHVVSAPDGLHPFPFGDVTARLTFRPSR